MALYTKKPLFIIQGFAITVVSFRAETTLRGRNMENNLQWEKKILTRVYGWCRREKYQGEWAAHSCAEGIIQETGVKTRQKQPLNLSPCSSNISHNTLINTGIVIICEAGRNLNRASHNIRCAPDCRNSWCDQGAIASPQPPRWQTHLNSAHSFISQMGFTLKFLRPRQN